MNRKLITIAVGLYCRDLYVWYLHIKTGVHSVGCGHLNGIGTY